MHKEQRKILLNQHKTATKQYSSDATDAIYKGINNYCYLLLTLRLYRLIVSVVLALSCRGLYQDTDKYR